MNDLVGLLVVFPLLLLFIGVTSYFDVKGDTESRENLKQCINELSDNLDEEGLELMDNLVMIYIKTSRTCFCLGEIQKWEKRKNNYLKSLTIN